MNNVVKRLMILSFISFFALNAAKKEDIEKFESQFCQRMKLSSEEQEKVEIDCKNYDLSGYNFTEFLYSMNTHDLRNIDFSHANLENCYFGSIFHKNKGKIIRLTIGYIKFEHTNLKKANFTSVHFYQWISFYEANLEMAKFNDSHFNEADESVYGFGLANLLGADFVRCKMNYGYFNQTKNIRNVDFCNSRFNKTIFIDLDFDHCDLDRANFFDCKEVRLKFRDCYSAGSHKVETNDEMKESSEVQFNEKDFEDNSEEIFFKSKILFKPVVA